MIIKNNIDEKLINKIASKFNVSYSVAYNIVLLDLLLVFEVQKMYFFVSLVNKRIVIIKVPKISFQLIKNLHFKHIVSSFDMNNLKCFQCLNFA